MVGIDMDAAAFEKALDKKLAAENKKKNMALLGTNYASINPYSLDQLKDAFEWAAEHKLLNSAGISFNEYLLTLKSGRRG